LNLTYEFDWSTQFDASRYGEYKKLVEAASADLKKS